MRLSSPIVRATRPNGKSSECETGIAPSIGRHGKANLRVPPATRLTGRSAFCLRMVMFRSLRKYVSKWIQWKLDWVDGCKETYRFFSERLFSTWTALFGFTFIRFMSSVGGVLATHFLKVGNSNGTACNGILCNDVN